MKTKGKIMKLCLILGSIILTIALLIGVLPFGVQNVSATIAESYHPYANNEDETWTISEPGADQMRLHFQKFQLQKSDADYLYLYDSEGEKHKTWGGVYSQEVNEEDYWSEWYATDTIKLTLKTDSEETAYGFLIDQVEVRTESKPSTSYPAESYHPYANGEDETWTISEPGADQMRLHFQKFQLQKSDADYLYLYDSEGEKHKTWGGVYSQEVNEEDYWSEWYATDTIKLTLKTDSEETAYGFLIDQVETRAESATPTATPTLAPTAMPTATPIQTHTPIPTPINIPTPVASPTFEYPTPSLKPGEPYVHLYGHKTDVTIGEEVILYLSVINPITSPGTLKVQLTLQVPSGWSITSGEFSPPVGGLQTAVYEIEQGPDSKTIGIHMLANQPFDGVITGYTDYYFIEEPESKYHGEINEHVTAQQEKPLPSSTPAPSETPAPTPGFEAIFAIFAIAIVVLVLRRK